MKKEYEDRNLYYDYVRQDHGAPPDPHPECAFHAIEISNEKALKNFITFYVKRPMSHGAQQDLEDILPNPGYHDPGYFHREENPNAILGCKYHYHILFDHVPNSDDIRMVIKRLENLGGTIHPPVKEHILKDIGDK